MSRQLLNFRNIGVGSLNEQSTSFGDNNFSHSRFQGRGSKLINQFLDLKAKYFPIELKKNEGEILMDFCRETYYASRKAKLLFRDLFSFQGRQLTNITFFLKTNIFSYSYFRKYRIFLSLSLHTRT